MAELHVTNDNFQQEVMRSDRPVLIDFWAPWCGPCRVVAPIITEIAEEYPNIKVAKVNVDDEMELAALFRVASIPTLVYMKDGKVVSTMVGARPKSQIVSLFD